MVGICSAAILVTFLESGNRQRWRDRQIPKNGGAPGGLLEAHDLLSRERPSNSPVADKLPPVCVFSAELAGVTFLGNATQPGCRRVLVGAWGAVSGGQSETL